MAGASNNNDDKKKRSSFRSNKWESALKEKTTVKKEEPDINALYKNVKPKSDKPQTPAPPPPQQKPVPEEPVTTGALGMGDLKMAEYQNQAPEFFQQEKPKLNDLYITPRESTTAPEYDYKKLDDKPILKKIYKSRVNKPEEREPEYPLPPVQETQTGSIIPSEESEKKLGEEELRLRGETLAKINNGEIKLPGFVSILPDNQKLAFVGATYNNNPVFNAITTIQEPLVHLENIVRQGIDKVFDTNLGVLETANMESEDEKDKLLQYGTELAMNLIPLGASIKGANLLLKGIKNPYLRHVLSSGLGFMINSQPSQLDNLSQGKIKLKDYAIQNAVDFGTGISFGLLPPGGKLRYEIPYQSVVPTMVPVLADLLQGKEIDSRQIIGDALTNTVLSLVMSGKLPKNTKVEEISNKLKNELKGFKEEQITPELVEETIVKLLPPARLDNTLEFSRVNRETNIPKIETVKVSEGKDVIEVSPEGTAEVKRESDVQPAALKIQLTEDQYRDMKNNGMTDAEIKEAQENLNRKIYPETPVQEQRIETPEEISVSEASKEIVKTEEKQTKPEVVTDQEQVKVEEAIKEPYEMTREEYIKNNPDKRQSNDNIPLGRVLGDAHENLINEAFKEGKTIPENVLKDYPDLTKSVKTEEIKTEPVQTDDIVKTEIVDEAKKELKDLGIPDAEINKLKPDDVVKKLHEEKSRIPEADIMQIKGKNIPKAPTKRKKSDPEETKRRQIFNRMTPGELDNYIKDRSEYFGSREEYMKTSEYQDIIEPVLLKQSENIKSRDKRLLDFEKERYEQGIINKEQYETNTQRIKDNSKWLRDRLISKDQYDSAKNSIKKRGINLYSNPLDPGVFKDLAVVGLYHLKNGAISFGEWAKRMVKELGNSIKPLLKNLWAEINNPKNVRLFKKNNPEAQLYTSGIDRMKLREKDGQPEDYRQYARRIAKEIGIVPDQTAYNDAKLVYESKNRKTEQPPADDTSKSPSQKNDLEKMRDDADRTKSSRPTAEEEIERFKRMQAKKKQTKSFTEKAIGKIPAIEEKITGNIYDKQEKVISELKKEVVNDPDFKKLQINQKKEVLKSLDTYYRERNKNSLGIDNELGTEFRENLFAKAWKRSIRQAVKVVEGMGEAGKEMASRFRKMSDDERKWMGTPSSMVLEISKLTKEEYQNLKDIRNWKRNVPTLTKKEAATKTAPAKDVTKNTEKLPAYINDNVMKADKLLDDYYDSIAKEFEDRGFMTRNKDTGEIYLFTPRREYEPRILKIDMDKFGVSYDKSGRPIHNKQREKVLEHLVSTGQAKNKAEAATRLDTYIAESRVNRAGNIEYSRTFDFPAEYYLTDPLEVMIKYATRVSNRLAFVDNFGMKGDIASNLIDEIRNNKKDYKFVQDLFRYETGNLNASERQALEYVNLAKGLQAMTKFTPFTTLRNSFQGLLGSSTRGNIISAVKGFIKSFSPIVKKEAYLSGALGDNIESIIKKEMGGDGNNVIGKMTSKYLDLIGFTASDRINRVISSAAGITFYESMLKRIGNNSILKKRAYREFDKIGLDPKEILERPDKKFTQEEKNLIMRTFSGDTQFNIRPQDLPLFWSSPFGKLVTQWKPFGYKMTQLIRDSIWKETKAGNLFPIFTMLTAYGVAGETANVIIDSLRSLLNFDPSKSDTSEEKMKSVYDRTLYSQFKKGDAGGFMKRLVDDLAGLGAMTMMVDILRSFGWGKSGAVGVVAGPTVGELTQTADDILRPTGELFKGEEEDWFNKTLKGVYGVTTRNVPGAGILRTFGVTKAMKDAMFKEKSSTDEFLQTLSKEEANAFDNIKELEKSRDKQKKRALETKLPEDVAEWKKLDKELAAERSKNSKLMGKKNKFDYDKKKIQDEILKK